MNKWFVIVLLVSLSACKGKYIASVFTSTSTQKTDLTKNVRLLTKPEQMWQISYTLDVPKEALRVEGKVRIIRDSLIWMNVKKLGLEAMRIKMTKDSVWILDRLKNKYFAGSYASFEKFAKIPFEFHLCQAIFLNEPYLELVKPEKATLSDSLITYQDILAKRARSLNIEQSYFLDPVYLNGFMFLSERINTKANIVYDYGKKLKLKGFELKTTNKNLPSAYFKMKEMETKDKMSVSFKIPRRYEKIRID